MVVTEIGSSLDEAFAVARQTDGKIVVAGESYNGTNFDFALVRYDQNGSPDASFGSGGIVTTPVGAGDDSAFAVLVQPDGMIVAAGESAGAIAVVRYDTNGAPDGTFGLGGKVVTPVGTRTASAWALVRQPADGKLVVAGYAYVGGNYDMALVRYESDGTPDSTFGTGGVVTTSIASGPGDARVLHETARDLALLSDGKLVAAGWSRNGGGYDFALVRYEDDGDVDGTFGTGGKVVTPVGSGNDFAESIAVQTDGKLVVAGVSRQAGGEDISLVRYKTDGGLDDTFGAGGKVLTPVGAGDDGAEAVVVAPTGEVVAAGYSYNGSTYDFAVAGYDGSGNLLGTTTIAIETHNFAHALLRDPDGRFVVVGGSMSPVGLTNFTLVRYLSIAGCG